MSVSTTGGTALVDGGTGDDKIKASTKGGGATTVDGGLGSDTCKVKGGVPTCEFAN